jgi:hypothetical protein
VFLSRVLNGEVAADRSPALLNICPEQQGVSGSSAKHVNSHEHLIGRGMFGRGIMMGKPDSDLIPLPIIPLPAPLTFPKPDRNR